MPETPFRERARALVHELAKFGTVGAAAFVVDLGIFNLLALDGHPMADRPTTATIISALVATVFSWILNRTWTFSKNATGSRTREFVTFLLINGVGIAIAAATLYIGTYTFDVTGNAGKNGLKILGIAIATIVRYFGYKFLVFRGDAHEDEEAITAAVDVFPPRQENPAAAHDQDPAGSARH